MTLAALTNSSYTSFLTTFLSTLSLNFFKSAGISPNLSSPNSVNLSKCNLSSFNFKLA